MNKSIENQPVFLLSMPRSGSTLLSLMLGNHSDVCCPPEPWIVLVLAEYLNLEGVRSVPYGRKWAEMAAIEFLLNPERKQRGALTSAFGKIEETFALSPTEAARKLLKMVYKMHLDVTGKSIFIDKTPRYYAVIGLINELFPAAKKIVLLRNPLEIYASYKSTWNNIEGIFTPEGVTVDTRDYCEGLFRLAELAATTNDNIFALRYEELVNEPEKILSKICDFLDIDFSYSMLTYHENKSLAVEHIKSPVGDKVSLSQSSINKHSGNTWETRLDISEIQSLVDVLGAEIFERLGYESAIPRLRDMSVIIPTEKQARERRELLMQTLVAGVQDQPFSIWETFVSRLRESQSELVKIRTISGFLRYRFGMLKRMIYKNLNKK